MVTNVGACQTPTPSLYQNVNKPDDGKERLEKGLLKYKDVRLKNSSDDTSMGCTFKRGGMCNQHGKIGSKNVLTRKVWTKTKDGIFKWVTKRQTTYICREVVRTVPEPVGSSNLVSGVTDSALGVVIDDSSNRQTVHMYSDSENTGLVGRDDVGQTPLERLEMS